MPESPSTWILPDHAPPRKTGKAWAALSAAAFLLVAGMGWFTFHHEGPHLTSQTGKHVTVLLTDLPGQYERLRIALAGVGVENYRLDLKVPSLEISAHHGLDGAVLVAEGYVPKETRGSLAILLASAEGYKDGAWNRLEVPRPVLVVENGVAPGEFAGNGAVVDLDLDASLQASDATMQFAPVMGNFYQYAGAAPGVGGDLQDRLSEFQRIDGAASRALTIPDAKDILANLCPGATGTDLVCTSSSVAACQAATDCKEPGPNGCASACAGRPGMESRAPQGTAAPTGVASNPAPADHGFVAGGSPRLEWSAPPGGPFTFDVVLDGTVRCTTSATFCAVSDVHGTSHTWQVKTTGSAGSITGPSWSFDVYTPSEPSPGNQEVEPTLVSPLTWKAVPPGTSTPVAYRVLIGTTEPSDVACTWSSTASCVPANLQDATLYSWTVETKIDGKVVAGPVWKFISQNAKPTAASAIGPEGSVPAGDVDVTWTAATDPEGKVLHYHVAYYYGSLSGSTQFTAWTSGTSATIPNVTVGGTVHWYVQTKEAVTSVFGPDSATMEIRGSV